MRGKRQSERWNLEQAERELEKIERDWLNPQQRKAVEVLQKESLQGDHFLLPVVEGPPGTGKTSTGATAVVKKLVVLNQSGAAGRYLVLCYTHVACLRFKDVLEKNLGIQPSDAVYLKPSFGGPPQLDPDRGIVSCDPYLRGLPAHQVRWLQRRPVLITTLLGVRRALSVLSNRRIYFMIDEFSQISKADFFACVDQVRRNTPYQYSLLGDPYQLPIVTTQTHLRPNIFEWLKPRGVKPVQLVKQYRMHEDICSTINKMREIFHSYPLESAESVRERTLTAMGYEWEPPQDPWMAEVLDPNSPLVLVDTSKLGYEEIQAGSIFFSREAELAARIALGATQSYHKGGTPLYPKILTPYNGQRDKIVELLPPPLRGEVMTIYKAQGAEYPFVIISFVRSNLNKFVGFLHESMLHQQVYVGCSRAQAKLIVLMSFDTFVEGMHGMFVALYNTPKAVKVEAKL
jgi:hypothetical protein